MSENYSETYERLKGTGVRPLVRFIPKMDEEEIFKVIEDKHVDNIKPDRYYVSNYGNIYDSKRERNISQKPDKDGYKTCSIICEDRYMKMKVHRLELSVFDYREDFDQLQVNHKDGIHDNNELTNLEWCTGKENSDHAMLYGLHNMNGSDNPNSKLTEDQVNEICKLIETGEYYDTEIAKMYGVSYTNISDIHKGKIWGQISKDYNLNIRKSRKKNI